MKRYIIKTTREIASGAFMFDAPVIIKSDFIQWQLWGVMVEEDQLYVLDYHQNRYTVTDSDQDIIEALYHKMRQEAEKYELQAVEQIPSIIRHLKPGA